jgi:hypothetical protein
VAELAHLVAEELGRLADVLQLAVQTGERVAGLLGRPRNAVFQLERPLERNLLALTTEALHEGHYGLAILDLVERSSE